MKVVSLLQPINAKNVQDKLNEYKNKTVYLHLETTSGAYTGYRKQTYTSSAYIRNGKITILDGKITGTSPYRVGIKIDFGWVYADGLTVYTIDEKNRLLLAGLDDKGKLAVCLQLSDTPFE